MGLDVVLGVIVLAMAVRGWLRGFWAQSIRLSGLVASVYAAEPLSDAARPWVSAHLASVDPGVLDRLLWWGSAVVSFFLMTGLATGVLNMVQRRRRLEGLPVQHRGDQSAGVLLGVAKGALLSAFVLEGIGSYSKEYTAQGGWFGQQVTTSKALPVAIRYRLAERLWNSEPVRHFVGVVRDRGIGRFPTPTEVLPAVSPGVEQPAGPIRTARRPAPLQAPRPPAPPIDPEAQLDAELGAIANELERLARPPGPSR